METQHYLIITRQHELLPDQKKQLEEKFPQVNFQYRESTCRWLDTAGDGQGYDRHVGRSYRICLPYTVHVAKPSIL